MAASKAIGFLNFKFSADLTAFERAMKKAQKNLKKFGKNLKKTGQTLSRNLTLPLLALGAASVKAFDQQAKAETKLLTALKGREDVQQRLIQQAKDLQKVSLFGDEATIEAQAMLAMFGLNEEQITTLIPLIQDMATGIEMDLVGATSLVAKSVSTSTDALKRYFDTGLSPTMTMQEKTIALSKSLTKAFEDQAFQASEVGAGPLVKMWMQLGDLSEEIGKRLMPHILKLVDVMKGLIVKFDGLTDAQKDNIVTWGLILGAIGPVLIILGTITLAFSALMTPVGLVTLAIGALVTALIYFKTSASNVAISVRNNFAIMANSIISSVNAVIAAMNMIGAGMDLIPMIALGKKSSPEAATESGFLKEMADSQAKFKALLEKFNQDFDGGTGGTGAGLEKTVEQMEALSLATNDTFEEIHLLSHRLDGLEMPENLFNTDPMDKYRGALGMLGDEIATFVGTDIKSMEEALASYVEKLGNNLAQGAESFEEYGNTVKGIMREVIGAMISAGVAAAVKNALETLPPFPGSVFLIPILAGAAAGLARTAFNSLIPEFAEGGIVSGPTLGLMGEYPGASSNPEVVAPLDKLKSMIGGNQNIIVEGVIKGNDIYLSNRNTAVDRLRTT